MALPAGRVLIIGLDGVTFDLIKPWVAEGRLPGLAKLMKGGVYGDLGSTMPPMSFPAWSSFLTGKNPGKHGIFDFTARRPHSYETQFINSTYRKAESMTVVMSNMGKRVASLSVPLTYPPEKINGVMISGFDAPGIGGVADTSAMHPPELYDRLMKEVGEYPISPNLEALTGDELLSALIETIEKKGKAALHIYRERPWDCFILMLGETDAVAHHFWKYYDKRSPLYSPAGNKPEWESAILSVYQAADKVIREFMAVMPEDTTIIIMSDHGHGGSGAKTIYMNRWLEGQGLLRFKGEKGEGKGRQFYQRLVRFFFNTSKTVGLKIMPVSIKKIIIRRTRIAGKMESWLRFSHMNWERTKAYSEETAYYPTIWINLKGREPLGIVEPGAGYDEVRQEIISRLLEWRDPATGQKVIRKVYKREEIYHGDYVDQAPDLVIEWNLDQGYSYLSRRSIQGGDTICYIHESEKACVKSGSHRDKGIFIAYGRYIRRHSRINDPGLIDLAPTALYLLDLPVPKDMDGRVLQEIIDEEYLASHPAKFNHSITEGMNRGDTVTYSDEEQDVISSRLKGLGYLD